MDLKKILIGTGILTVIVGASIWIKNQVELSSKLIYNSKNPKLKKVTPTEVIVEFDMTIENPTNLNIIMNGMDVDVYANGVKVTNIFSQIQVPLISMETASIPLRLSINPTSLIQNTGVLFQTGLSLNNVVLTLKGYLKLKKFGIPLRVPFVYTSTYGELMG